MFRIAHISDLHVLSPFGFEWRKALFNKRLTGYANLIRQRGRVYRREYLLEVLAGAIKADHVVVTGDITNLSLEREFEEARKLLDEAARSVEVTVVPGNHDAYMPSIVEERRFARYFHHFMRSDLPEFAQDLPAGPLPCVKLRGPVAIVALSSAVARPPFFSGGRIGDVQLDALEAILAHPEVSRRTPVVLLHHPLIDDRFCLERRRDGLADAERLRGILRRLGRGLVLFGHVHRRGRQRMGALDVVSASGAALDHRDPAVRAGFNEYDIADDGSLARAEAYVVSAGGHTLERTPIPSLEDSA